MKRIRFIIAAAIFLSSLPLQAQIPEKSGVKPLGCLLVVDIASGKTILETDPAACAERFYPCSTFKVPLAAMALDSGALRNESEILKWDGSAQPIPAWEQSHNAKSWMRESVVWFSQRLTPKIGSARIVKYLADFSYGNKDFSGGLTKAWLSSSLRISAREQVDFLRKLQRQEFSLRHDAARRTIALLPEEASRTGRKIVGKTGSGASWSDPVEKQGEPYRIGWYIGYMEHQKKYYAFAFVFREATESGKFVYSGQEAKAMAVRILDKLE